MQQTYHFLLAIVEPFSNKSLLLALQSLQFLLDIGVNEVGNVFAIHNLRYNVELPLRVLQDVVLYDIGSLSGIQKTARKLTLEIDIINTGAALFSFNIPFEPSLHASLLLFKLDLDSFRNKRLARNVISGFWLSDVDSVDDRVDFGSLDFVSNPVSQQRIARLGLELHNTLIGITRDLDTDHALFVDDFIDKNTILGGEVVKTHNVDLVDDEDRGFIGKEGFDRMEEFALGFDAVAALFA